MPGADGQQTTRLRTLPKRLKRLEAKGLVSLRRIVTFRNFTVAVGLCLTASAFMALAPFVNPQVPLAPFIAANGVLWMLVAGVFRRSKAEWVSHAESVWWDRLTSLALVSFTLAGFFALYHGDTLIAAGDLTQVR